MNDNIKAGSVTCRLCGKHVTEIKGYLGRVNPRGVIPAIWECRPSCDATLTQDEALLAAIEPPSVTDQENNKCSP